MKNQVKEYVTSGGPCVIKGKKNKTHITVFDVFLIFVAVLCWVAVGFLKDEFTHGFEAAASITTLLFLAAVGNHVVERGKKGY